MNGIEPNIIRLLESHGQGHVLQYWDSLSRESRAKLESQLRSIDWRLFETLVREWEKRKCTCGSRPAMEPAPSIPLPRTDEEKRKAREAFCAGESLIRAGRVAAFMVAGGQGTRLGFSGPKGMFPIGPVSGKTLFQLHAEKIAADRRHFGVRIPWYIMTSESNDAETKRFFHDHTFFGLPEEDIFFLQQRMLPALNEEGKIILDAKDHVFMNPNGHGGSLLALYESGALDHMRQRGIEVISYFQVDNVLVTIIDPAFIGYHFLSKSSMSSKMLMKRDPLEKVGLFVRIGGILRVIEYTELTVEEKHERLTDGSFKYGAGSIAIHLFNRSFVEALVQNGFKLPYHMAHKKIPFLDRDGRRVEPSEPNGYKFESFVFDALMYAGESVVMEVAREEEFSPVKNAQGDDSPESARRDMSNRFGRWLEAAGCRVAKDEKGNTRIRIEISPLFARTQDECIGASCGSLDMEKDLYLGS